MFECPRKSDGSFDCQADYPTSDTYCCNLWTNRRRKNISANVESSYPEYQEEMVKDTYEMVKKLHDKIKWTTTEKQITKKDTKPITKKGLYSYD